LESEQREKEANAQRKPNMITMSDDEEGDDAMYFEKAAEDRKRMPPPNAREPRRSHPPSDEGPRTFAELQGKMTFVQASDDPFNNAVSFSSTERHRRDAAEVMPDGYNDTEADRLRLLDLNPKDDNALLAPRGEEINEFLEASSDLFRRKTMVASTNTRRLGVRSMLWPALDEADYHPDGDGGGGAREPKRSYANYGTEMEFDRRAEEAMCRGRHGNAT
jgi:hypothetical protein